MLNVIKPSAIAVTQNSIPEYIRDANPNFVALIKHYYDWMAQDGNPLDLLQNMVEYRDTDETTPEYLQLITKQLLDFIPSTSTVNKKLVAQKIKDFYKAKGTLPSYDFIMNILFNDTADIEWNSGKVFRPSSNGTVRDGFISVYSQLTAFDSSVIGSTLVQTYPSPASLYIDNCVPVILSNGMIANVMDANPETVIGTFVVGGTVQVLRNTVDRSWIYADTYYTPISFDTVLGDLVASIYVETVRQYQGLVVRQVGSNFRGVISSMDNRIINNSQYQLVFSLSNISGVFDNGDIYFVNAAIEATTFTKGDYFFGNVAPSVTDIAMTNGGALHDTGEMLEYIGGTGTPFTALVNDIGGGPIDNINIVSNGFGYSVGDKVISDNSQSYGSGLDAVVTTIDGVGAAISETLELDAFSIRNGGNQFVVGDVITLTDGVSDIADYPTTLTVASIVSNYNLNSIVVTNGGWGYQYANLVLLNNDTNALIAGFSAVATITNGSVSSIQIISCPTLTTTNVHLLINGYGAAAHCTVAGGVVNTITIDAGGWNYLNPWIVVLTPNGNPSALAQFTITKNNVGTITGINIVNGGTNYGTNPVVYIFEMYGLNSSTSPIINHIVGPIATLAITHRGTYSSLPNCFNTPYSTNSANGQGLILDVKYRIKTVVLTNPGAYYRTVGVDMSAGVGKNAILIPVISNGVINTFTMGVTGSGYTYANVSIIGTGVGFSGTATIVSGQITGIVVTNGGIGYSVTDTIKIVGNGINATATMTIRNGTVKQIAVVNGGQDYAYDTSLAYAMRPADYPNAIAGTFTPIIVNGVIKSVTVVDGGSGYVSGIAQNGIYNEPVISSGVPATITVGVAGHGSVQTSTINAGGTGYYATSEVTPLKIQVNSSLGVGAVIVPVLELGSIIQCRILHGGGGYISADTITVLGGSGNSASLKPIISNGKVVDIIIINKGSSYKYGTSALVVGDGTGATLSVNVNTSISAITPITGGSGYPANTIIVITDSTGSGAVANAVLDGYGSITGINVVSGGTLYTNPIITTVPSLGATFHTTIPRNIQSASVVSHGTGYTSAVVFVVGDGTDGALEVQFENNGSLTAPILVTQGSGYVSNPNSIITDTSGYGAVTSVKILNPGDLYTRPPILSLPIKYDIHGVNIIASGTQFSCYGTNVGHIRGVAFTSFGTGWKEKPHFIFPLHCIMQQNVNFVVGESITVARYPYTPKETSFNLYQENGGLILIDLKVAPLACEDGTGLLTEDGADIDVEDSGFFEQEFYEITDVNGKLTPYYDAGPTGVVVDLDFARDTVELGSVAEDYDFILENGEHFISENNLQIKDESSNGIEIGDSIIGLQSHAVSTVKWYNRANGDAVVTGLGRTKKTMTNTVGILNNAYSKIHDGQRIQDYSYIVRTGTSLDKYKTILTSTVHPAGYEMYGDVRVQSFTVANPVSIPYSFGIKGATGSFSTTLNLKSAFFDMNALHNKNLFYYAGSKQYWYTTEATEFADYTFENYDPTSSNFISNHKPLAVIEPYVSKMFRLTGSTTINTGNITGLSTAGINIGYRIIAWDSLSATVFQENKIKNEDATLLLTEDSFHLLTDEPFTYVTSVGSTSIVASKNAGESVTATVVVEDIPDLYLI
jgi:hypothetical protein